MLTYQYTVRFPFCIKICHLFLVIVGLLQYTIEEEKNISCLRSKTHKHFMSYPLCLWSRNMQIHFPLMICINFLQEDSLGNQQACSRAFISSLFYAKISVYGLIHLKINRYGNFESLTFTREGIDGVRHRHRHRHRHRQGKRTVVFLRSLFTLFLCKTRFLFCMCIYIHKSKGCFEMCM